MGVVSLSAAAAAGRPNVLFFIMDDQSAAHCGAYGAEGVATPAFDRIAAEGVLFENAFCAAPSCTPSRSALLTGQAIYRLGAAGVLMGELSSDLPIFPLAMEEAGYFVGHTGKTWSPGKLVGAWNGGHPVGKGFQGKKLVKEERRRGMSATDYAANFGDFLAERPEGAPFFFWLGTSEPHLGYDVGAGVRSGKKLGDAAIFGGWPDEGDGGEVFRSDVLDGYLEIEHADRHLGRALAMLEAAGELANTIVVATSDHGTPLARAKCSLYDAGTRVPLAVRFPERVPAGRRVTDFASLTDVAPTLLEAAGLAVPEATTGRSLWNVLESENGGRVDHSRDRAVVAFERHTWCRPGGLGYPMRALRTDQFLYIRNYEPGRWPAGDPDFNAAPQGFCGDVDKSPSKTWLVGRTDDPAWAFCYGKRPGEELYDLESDPEQVVDVAGEAKYADIKAMLASQLIHYQRKTADPRVEGKTEWDGMPYHGRKPKK